MSVEKRSKPNLNKNEFNRIAKIISNNSKSIQEKANYLIIKYNKKRNPN